MDEFELITAVEVARLLKCSRSQVYKMRSAGLLPRPIQIFPGERGTRWVRRDVVDFVLQARSSIEIPLPRPFVPVEVCKNKT